MCQNHQDDLDRQAYCRIFASVNTYSQLDATKLRAIRNIVLNQLYQLHDELLAYHQEQVANLQKTTNRVDREEITEECLHRKKKG